MLNKVLLITIFILLTWNTFDISKTNSALKSQINELVNHSESTKKHIIENQVSLEELLLLQKKGNQLMSNTTTEFANIKTTLNDIKSSVDGNKKSIAAMNTLLKKKGSHLPKTSSQKTPDKKKAAKPLPKKESSVKNSESLQMLTSELAKTKELYNKKATEEMIVQLAKLKTEVWKSRKVEGISKDLVMSILSSIDITNKKWINKETTYTLESVENKINKLVSEKGTSK